MNTFEIRQAKLKDIPKFYPVFKTCLETLFPDYTETTKAFFTDIPYKKSTLISQLKNKDKILLLAFDKDIVVGFFLVQKHYYGVSMAYWLAVVPEYQGHGIASHLIKLWEDITLEQGGHALQLWTSENNLPFYKNRGLTLVGKFPKAWYGVDVYLLYKALRSPDEKNYLKDYLAKKNSKR